MKPRLRPRPTARALALALAAVASALALVLTGCSTATDGTPATAPPTSTTASSTGTMITTTTAVAQQSGKRQGATADITVTKTAQGPSNEIMALAISDAQDFWTKADRGVFQPRSVFLALPGPDSGNDCLAKLDFARACSKGIAWETPRTDTLLAVSGQLGVTAIAAHEVGHLVEWSRYPDTADMNEKLADCLAGVYMRTVSDGASSRFVGTRAEIEAATTKAFDVVKGEKTRATSVRMQDFNAGYDGNRQQCFDTYRPGP